MELGTLANLAEIIGGVMVVGGIIFGVAQLRLFQRQRRERAAFELARSFQNPQFAHALKIVFTLPPGLSAEELRERGSEVEDAAVLVSLTLESVGIMVHRRIVPIDVVWELMGGVLLGAWERLEGWAHDLRREQESDKFDEWIEWLTGQLRRHAERVGPAAAHQRYLDWRP